MMRSKTRLKTIPLDAGVALERALKEHSHLPLVRVLRVTHGPSSSQVMMDEDRIAHNHLMRAYFVKRMPGYARRMDALFALVGEEFVRTAAVSSLSCRNDAFFAKRVPRLRDWYLSGSSGDSRLMDDLLGKRLRVNGIETTQTLREMMHETIAYFSRRHRLLTVYGQGDFHEMNVSLKPLLFDLDILGRNSFVGEYSVFFWSTLFHEAHLIPRYNAAHLGDLRGRERTRIAVTWAILDDVVDIVLSYEVSVKRRLAIDCYTQNVVLPMCEIDTGWIADLRHYLLMRVLCIIDVSRFEDDDLVASVGFLGLFWMRMRDKRDIISWGDLLMPVP